jgi:hypothetical protein
MMMNSSASNTPDGEPTSGLTMEKMLEALAKIPPAPERKLDGLILSMDSLEALKKLVGAVDQQVSYIVGSLSGIEIKISAMVPFGTAVMWKHGKSWGECLSSRWDELPDLSDTLPQVVGILDFRKELNNDDSE